MKIQELAIIFIIIILPISLLLSEYTQFQIQTLKMQTEYDAKLTAATYDAIKAFQLNSTNSTTSDLANSKMRDLEASVVSFRNSIMSAFKLNGYTEEDLNNYIPALVYTLYDGFYIYSPYNNNNYRYETDDEGNIVKDPVTNAPIGIDENGEDLYGLKPYISYSCRYIKADKNIDVVITYALDNYVTVQGIIDNKYVNKSGYLIDNIIYTPGVDNDGDGVEDIRYNDVYIKEEQLLENIGGNVFPYFKNNGTKYYLVGDQIVYISNGTITVQFDKTRDPAMFEQWKNLILNNNYAREYYKEAKEFSEWFEDTSLDTLTYGDARDEVINEDGTTTITKVWDATTAEYTKKIFNFNSSSDPSKNIENELSTFNQHRLAIIRHKIETNLAIAISNYNSFSGATANIFQMPELKEDEWEHITNNISLISFLQGLPIGGKIYNGYTLVTNSESKEVVLEENIYILGDDDAYHRIGDNVLEVDDRISEESSQVLTSYSGASTNVGIYGSEISTGRLNLDFERTTLINNDNIQTFYYYPLTAYNASYNSIVMQNDVTTYDDIYEYVNEQDDGDLKIAFYTALGRERAGKFNSNVIIDTGTIQPGGSSGGTTGGTGTPDGTETPDVPVEPETFTVTFNPNGGIGGPSQITAIPAGTEITIPDQIPLREGYEFAYWSTAYGLTYNKGSKYTVTGNITFTAVWDKILETYTVAYEPNGGANEPADQVKIEGTDLKLSEQKPTRSGFIFLGWATSATGTVEYGPGYTYTDDAPLTLYAIWEKIPETYTITYNANGGTGAPNAQTKTEGENLTLTTEKPTRSGYEFKGWSTSATGTVQYQSGGTYSNDANVTLYAVWEADEYEVKYDANGGSGEPATQTKTHGVNLTLSTTQPTRSGYTFKGWATSATGSVQYQPGATYSNNASVTLYAVWEADEYEVKYNANGGSGEPAAQKKTHGVNLTLSTTQPTRSGYEFKGWATSATGSVQYQPGATYSNNASVTLYAVWEAYEYEVKYNANGGSGEPVAQKKTHGVNLTLSTTQPTRSGYTFKGWATSATGTVQYQPGGTYSNDANVTLYAVWEQVLATYRITYDANGGSGGPGSQDVTEGQTATIPSDIPTKKRTINLGFFSYEVDVKFLGWSIIPEASNAQYQPGNQITPTESMTLYAVWEGEGTIEVAPVNTYLITYDANGGSGGPGSQTVVKGETATIPSTVPTKRKYMIIPVTFLGWKDENGNIYQPGGTITPTKDMTLYAVWDE